MQLITLHDIERAIDALTPQEREDLSLWLDEHYPQAIDVQLKVDLEAGRIDDRITRAIEDHTAARTQPL